MSLRNQNWITFGGEPVTGRTPTQVRVNAPVPGQTMTPEQAGFVAHAYKLFCDAISVSAFPDGYHVQNRKAPDGTTVRMESINGVHRVFVQVPGKQGSAVEFPWGIGFAFTDLAGMPFDEHKVMGSDEVATPKPYVLAPAVAWSDALGRYVATGPWTMKSVEYLRGGQASWASSDGKFRSSKHGNGALAAYQAGYTQTTFAAGGIWNSAATFVGEWTPSSGGRMLTNTITDDGQTYEFALRSRYHFAGNEAIALANDLVLDQKHSPVFRLGSGATAKYGYWDGRDLVTITRLPGPTVGRLTGENYERDPVGTMEILQAQRYNLTGYTGTAAPIFDTYSQALIAPNAQSAYIRATSIYTPTRHCLITHGVDADGNLVATSINAVQPPAPTNAPRELVSSGHERHMVVEVPLTTTGRYLTTCPTDPDYVAPAFDFDEYFTLETNAEIKYDCVRTWTQTYSAQQPPTRSTPFLHTVVFSKDSAPLQVSSHTSYEYTQEFSVDVSAGYRTKHGSNLSGGGGYDIDDANGFWGIDVDPFPATYNNSGSYSYTAKTVLTVGVDEYAIASEIGQVTVTEAGSTTTDSMPLYIESKPRAAGDTDTLEASATSVQRDVLFADPANRVALFVESSVTVSYEVGSLVGVSYGVDTMPRTVGAVTTRLVAYWNGGEVMSKPLPAAQFTYYSNLTGTGNDGAMSNGFSFGSGFATTPIYETRRFAGQLIDALKTLSGEDRYLGSVDLTVPAAIDTGVYCPKGASNVFSVQPFTRTTLQQKQQVFDNSLELSAATSPPRILARGSLVPSFKYGEASFNDVFAAWVGNEPLTMSRLLVVEIYGASAGYGAEDSTFSFLIDDTGVRETHTVLDTIPEGATPWHKANLSSLCTI